MGPQVPASRICSRDSWHAAGARVPAWMLLDYKCIVLEAQRHDMGAETRAAPVVVGMNTGTTGATLGDTG